MVDLTARLRSALDTRYVIHREIGRGGMAVVFAGVDLEHDRPVAIKVLRPDIASHVGDERFLHEIQLARELQHPYILPVFDSGEADGLLYFTMPLIEGETLEDKLSREHQLPIEESVAIAIDICEALSHLHDHGYVHRDIKPGNVMFQDGHATLVDFGIGRAIDLAGTDRMTDSGVVLGTPSYMSPEQSAPDEYIDGRADVYSLGVILFEMLTGSPPFTGATSSAVITRHAASPVPSIRVVRPTVTPALEAVIERSLAKAPADRFATAADFSRALANPPELHTRKRRVTPAAFVATVMLVVVVSLAARSLFTSASPDPGPPTLDPRRIAVLPFDAPREDPYLANIAQGLTRDLISALQEVGDLTLISLAGVAGLTNDTPIDSVKSRFKVGTIVSGSVEPLRTDSLRVELRLTNAETSELIGSIRQSQGRSESILMRDTLVAQVSDRLRQRLGLDIRMRQLRAGASSDSAWRLAQRAYALSTVGQDSLSVSAAGELLDAAIRLDPDWGAPVVQRAWVDYWLGLVWSDDRRDSLFANVVLLADSALSIDPDNADALAVKGATLLRQWEFVDSLHTRETLITAENLLSRSADLDPDHGTSWNTLSAVQEHLGNTEGALHSALRAIQADPYLRDIEPTMTRLVFAYLAADKLDSARILCYEGVARFPQSRALGYCRLSVLAYAGRGKADIDSAWSALAWAHDHPMAPLVGDSLDPLAHLNVAAVLARSGLRDSALSIANRTRGLLRSNGRNNEMLVTEAHVRTLAGQPDSAIALLARALELDPRLEGFLSRVQWFRPLHGDARFLELLDVSPAPGDR